MHTTPQDFAPHVPQVFAKPPMHLLIGLIVLLLDLLTGPFLLFPILFVIPVLLSAWFSDRKWAFAFSVFLPLGRLIIAVLVEAPVPFDALVANALIRVAVLSILAFFISRTARLTRALEERIAGLVTMCAWSHTIEYEGEWISFEEYLKRRFDLDTTHGISPTEAKKALEQINPTKGNG